MINVIRVRNYIGDSLEIKLSEPMPEHGLLVTKITGLGPVKADINITNSTTSDGGVYNSSRAQTRNIVITFKFVEAKTIEDTRQRTYKYFPLKKPLYFEVETDNRKLCTTGHVESNEPDIFSKEEGCDISIVCDDSYFHEVDTQINTMMTTVNPEFEFPFENNSVDEKLIEFGDIVLKQECNLIYHGDVETGLIIKAHAIGTVRNIVIYNLTTRGRITINTDIIETLTGQGIVSSDTIIINTNDKHQNVQLYRGGITYNILNAIDKTDLEWFKISKGDNIFAYTAEEGETKLLLELQNEVLFEGI